MIKEEITEHFHRQWNEATLFRRKPEGIALQRGIDIAQNSTVIHEFFPFSTKKKREDNNREINRDDRPSRRWNERVNSSAAAAVAAAVIRSAQGTAFGSCACDELNISNKEWLGAEMNAIPYWPLDPVAFGYPTIEWIDIGISQLVAYRRSLYRYPIEKNVGLRALSDCINLSTDWHRFNSKSGSFLRENAIPQSNNVVWEYWNFRLTRMISIGAALLKLVIIYIPSVTSTKFWVEMAHAQVIIVCNNRCVAIS